MNDVIYLYLYVKKTINFTKHFQKGEKLWATERENTMRSDQIGSNRMSFHVLNFYNFEIETFNYSIQTEINVSQVREGLNW